MEILAPAGGKEQLIAAVYSGADAVYLGTKGFNARRKADNFGEDELKKAVAWCHGRGVRVHVTVNTLVTDGELPALYETVREVAGSGADAVILQDLAAAALFRAHVPDLPRHASTQMSIHNAEGALLAKELGFSRVILARELSLSEIRKIREKVDIELECFVHGALCMGVSGQCLLSAFLGERSGNRGLCAQPCRLDFRAGERSYALSLKDACLIPYCRELAEAGVTSLKIEGRLRRPEYVAAAVDACRKSLAGEEPDLTDLEKVFSRSGFTDGYLRGKRDLSMFGRRTEEDKADSAAVLGRLSGLYRREMSRVEVDMDLKLKPGENVELRVETMNGFQFVGWYTNADAQGTPKSASKAFTYTPTLNLTLYALFATARRSLCRWEGSNEPKTMTWRSKTYEASKPFAPSACRVDALGYPPNPANVLALTVDMFSAPDVAAQPTGHVTLENISNQSARRLPVLRQERYMQIEVVANREVDAVLAGTSMGGLAT